jgi:hypothetical protein
MAVGDQDEAQGGEVLKRNSRGSVSFEDVEAFQVEWVGEKILPVEMDQDSRMADKDGGVFSLLEKKGASGKIGSPRF